MLLDIPSSKARVPFRVTTHNECADYKDPIGAWLIGNVLFFQVPLDTELGEDEDDMLFFYQVTNEQRDQLLSWPEGERDISVEWVYVNGVDPNRPPLEPRDFEGLDEEEAEQYSIELDISL